MTDRMIEEQDRRVWLLYGNQITRLCLGYQVELLINWTHPDIAVIIEEPFRLRSDDGEETFDPEQPQTLGSLSKILYRPIKSLTAFREGRLVLKFVDGAELIVEKSQQYESWEAHGEGIEMLCSPHDGPPWRED